MAVIATFPLTSIFRVQVNDTGTLTLQELISASWTTPKGGPYTKDQILELWQALAEIGMGA